MSNYLPKYSPAMLIVLFFLTVLSSGFAAASINSIDEKQTKDSLKNEVMTLETSIDGKEVKYKGEFVGGELKTLYKNETKVSNDDFKKEKKTFLKKLNKLNNKNQPRNASFTWVSPDELDIEVDVDVDKIQKNIFMLQKKLSNLDSLQSIELDSLHAKMKKFHIVIEDDFDALSDKKMIKPYRKFKRFYVTPPHFDHKIEIDIKEENEELDKANKELEKSKIFLDDLKSELLKDGLIKEGDEEIKIEIEDDEITINDKPIPKNLKEKYKKLLDDKK